jgi:hypothetical protein
MRFGIAKENIGEVKCPPPSIGRNKMIFTSEPERWK